MNLFMLVRTLFYNKNILPKKVVIVHVQPISGRRKAPTVKRVSESYCSNKNVKVFFQTRFPTQYLC